MSSTASGPAAATIRGGRRAARNNIATGKNGRAGHTRISTTALVGTIRAVASEAFTVPAAQVKAKVRDDDGKLRISLSVPILVPSLLEAARHPEKVRTSGGTLYERSDAARAGIHGRVTRLTGSEVGRIDIALTGIHQPRREKVQ